MQLIEASNWHKVEVLLERHIDIVLGPNMIVPPAIRQRVVYQENFALVLLGNHSITDENFIDLSQVASVDFILPPKAQGIGYVEAIESMCQQYGFIPFIHYESAYSGTVLRLVEAGMGMGVEPLSAITD